MLLLPEEAWNQLSELSTLIEEVGSLPESACHWRLAFVPEEQPIGNETHSPNLTGTSVHVPGPDEVKPIAVGQLLYSLWAGIRAQECSNDISATFASRQAGGRKTHDAETLVMDIVQAEDVQQLPFIGSYDYKAFAVSNLSWPLKLCLILGFLRSL